MDSDIDKKIKFLSTFVWLGGLFIASFGYSGFIGGNPTFIFLTIATFILTCCIIAYMVYLYYFCEPPEEHD